LPEDTETVTGFVETRLAAFQRLLEHRAPDLFLFTTFLQQGLDRFKYQVQRFLFLVILPGLCAGGRLFRVFSAQAGL
jgi:hypothetical protein